MANLLEGKVVVLTGAVGLLGQTFSRGIVDKGGTVVLADINRGKGAELADELNRCSGRADAAFFHFADITDVGSVRELITGTGNKYNKIDALVNNAYPRNKNYGRKFEDVTFEDFNANVNLHLGGYFLTTQQFALFFQKQGYGNIINMSSIYGTVVPRFEIYEGTAMTMPVEYAVIKSALINLTRYVAKYFKGSKLRVNSISPGGIIDGQPVEFLEKYNALSMSKGMLEKEDIVGALIFLLSDLSEFVNGQDLIVDDGFSL